MKTVATSVSSGPKAMDSGPQRVREMDQRIAERERRMHDMQQEEIMALRLQRENTG